MTYDPKLPSLPVAFAFILCVGAFLVFFSLLGGIGALCHLHPHHMLLRPDVLTAHTESYYGPMTIRKVSNTVAVRVQNGSVSNEM